MTSSFLLRGRYLRDWAGFGVPVDTAPLCVAGVALGDIRRRFTWQAWHLVTSTVVLRGRRATCGTGLALVAMLRPPLCRATLRGRRGTWWHPPSFHVAGVALGDIYHHLPSFCVAGVLGIW